MWKKYQLYCNTIYKINNMYYKSEVKYVCYLCIIEVPKWPLIFFYYEI